MHVTLIKQLFKLFELSTETAFTIVRQKSGWSGAILLNEKGGLTIGSHPSCHTILCIIVSLFMPRSKHETDEAFTLFTIEVCKSDHLSTQDSKLILSKAYF